MAGSAAAAGLLSGTTAVLALLWLVAALLAGAEAPAARALDPGVSGSLAAWWAGSLLWLALAVALVPPRTRVLALAPAALLAGEVGELHIRLAELLARAADLRASLPWLKAGAALSLAGPAFGALWRARHDVCCSTVAAAIAAAGGLALVADLLGGWVGGGPWLAAGEEWAEVAAYALLASLCLRAVHPSRFGTMFSSAERRVPPAIPAGALDLLSGR